MNLYPGDIKFFVLSLERADGTAPTVGVVPTIRILNLTTGEYALSTPTTMQFIAGTSRVYSYRWDTTGLSEGSYLATVTYALDGNAYSNRLLERVQLGDSRITGEVAREATTAKEETTAKDATVLHAADFQTPDASVLLQGVHAKLEGYPASIPSSSDFTALRLSVDDLHDNDFGDWQIDRSTGELTLYRKNGDVLRRFTLQKTGSFSKRLNL